MLTAELQLSTSKTCEIEEHLLNCFTNTFAFNNRKFFYSSSIVVYFK